MKMMNSVIAMYARQLMIDRLVMIVRLNKNEDFKAIEIKVNVHLN